MIVKNEEYLFLPEAGIDTKNKTFIKVIYLITIQSFNIIQF